MHVEVAVPLLLVLGSVVVGGAARRFDWPGPLVLVAVGLALAYVPGVPTYQLDPTVVLYLFLPPLLFSAGFESSFVSLRRNIRTVVLLSVGLVLFTLLVVGLAAWAVLPALTLPAAFTLGAIVAPPDAVAATAIARNLGLPQRLITLLGGESLFNDATALTSYQVAVSAATGLGFSYLSGGVELVVATAVGVAYGMVVGWVVVWLTRLLREPVLENTAWLAVPFIAYLPAELMHGSGVLAVVVAGVYLGYHQSQATYASRLQAASVWKIITFVLESLVFALIGLQLPNVVAGLAGADRAQVALGAVVVLLVVITARFVWIFPSLAFGRLLRLTTGGERPVHLARGATLLSWAGMRGVVSLAAAAGLPDDFPQRNLVVFLTFVVTVGTLLLQGSTLAPLIRLLGLSSAGRTDRQTQEEIDALAAGAQAAVDRLAADAEDESTPAAPDAIVQRLRASTELRHRSARTRLAAQTSTADGADADDRGAPAEPPSAAYRRLRLAMIGAERDTYVELRNAGRLEDDTFRRLQHQLDQEEAILVRD